MAKLLQTLKSAINQLNPLAILTNRNSERVVEKLLEDLVEMATKKVFVAAVWTKAMLVLKTSEASPGWRFATIGFLLTAGAWVLLVKHALKVKAQAEKTEQARRRRLVTGKIRAVRTSAQKGGEKNGTCN